MIPQATEDPHGHNNLTCSLDPGNVRLWCDDQAMGSCLHTYLIYKRSVNTGT